MTEQARAHRSTAVQRHDAGHTVTARHCIAVETPVAMVYQGMPHVVMMASPMDLEDFGLGFSLSEGIIQHAEEMLGLQSEPAAKGIVLKMRIDEQRFQNLFDRHRFLPGRTGCGLCGVESLEQAIPELRPVPDGRQGIAAQAIYRAYAALHDRQPEKQATGAVHGAAWCSAGGEIRLLREDVGRHNALDKLIGAMVRSDLDFNDGFCLITSRCSHEMVQKAIQMGIGLIAAISAPTTLAVELADAHNLTLVALARANTFTVFTHAERIAGRPRILDDDRLVHKVNQIALFHQAYPQDQAVAGVAEHLKQFWTPLMRQQLIEFAGSAGADRLHQLVREAVVRL